MGLEKCGTGQRISRSDYRFVSGEHEIGWEFEICPRFSDSGISDRLTASLTQGPRFMAGGFTSGWVN